MVLCPEVSELASSPGQSPSHLLGMALACASSQAVPGHLFGDY